MKRRQIILILTFLILSVSSVSAKRYHVGKNGNDSWNGTIKKPFGTISAAAKLAGPGDVIVVHEGVYREEVAPPRGGESDAKRIVYRSARGEKVIIKGSEVIKNWSKIENDTWKVVISNTFFGKFNPYSDLIKGDWFNPLGRRHHTGAVYLDNHWLTEAAKYEDVLKPVDDRPLWFARVDDNNTTIWAQFKGVNPNDTEVEINVRQSVFYPRKENINYITVRGFTMMHAATNWAPPTAEQVGLIGTHWSKGWVIENNDISYSTCVGVTLGKHGDEYDNTSQNSAEGYVETIKRALKKGWAKENIGSHIVRNNHISHCEQAGLVGSMGAAFSRIINNEIHDIHVRRLFTGAEMAGIKIHAAIDTLIKGNHIYRTSRGIWLDWMAQGTRVTCNLLHDNNVSEDLFVEVNHGPFMVDNNIFLSARSLRDWSQGGAYCHNLFAGDFIQHSELNRQTPYHKAHSTELAGLLNISGGDDRFYNNIFITRPNMTAYDKAARHVIMACNIFYNGAKPSVLENNPVVVNDFNPGVRLEKKADGLYLTINPGPGLGTVKSQFVTTELLGMAEVSNLPYKNPDQSDIKINTDYSGKKRDISNPTAGPFEGLGCETVSIKVR